MGKIEENKQLKKQKLMDAAFRLFTSKGIIRTSISDIVKESGMAKGTFYLYFRDKYDLQEKLIAYEAHKIFHSGLDKSDYQSKDTPEEKVLSIVSVIVDELCTDKALFRFINKNLGWGMFQNAVSDLREEFDPVFSEVLELEDREKIKVLLYMIIEFVGSTCHSVILEESPMDIETYKPYLNNGVRGIMRTFYENLN